VGFISGFEKDPIEAVPKLRFVDQSQFLMIVL
jgi:hypothetical protein